MDHQERLNVAWTEVKHLMASDPRERNEQRLRELFTEIPILEEKATLEKEGTGNKV